MSKPSDLLPYIHDKHHYIGAFANDQIPFIHLDPCQFALINTDDVKGNGKHWVGLRRPCKGNYIMFFDSFNQPPVQSVVDYAFNRNLDLYANDDDSTYMSFQHVRATSCGYFTVVWFNNVKNLSDFKKFNKVWNNSPHVNEQILMNKLDLHI